MNLIREDWKELLKNLYRDIKKIYTDAILQDDQYKLCVVSTSNKDMIATRYIVKDVTVYLFKKELKSNTALAIVYINELPVDVVTLEVAEGKFNWEDIKVMLNDYFSAKLLDFTTCITGFDNYVNDEEFSYGAV